MHVHERDLDLRAPLRTLYPRLRRAYAEGGSDGAAALEPVPPVLAGRCLRVLDELGLARVDDGEIDVPPPAERTELERSPAFLAYAQRLEEGRRWLIPATPRAA